MKVVCAVLAAGESKRLGQPKQLLEVRRRPLLARIVEACAKSRVDEVAVVLGARADELSATFEHTRADTLHNPRWAEGMSTSMHSAVYWARARGADALMLCVCDQPLLATAHLDLLRDEFLRTGLCVASFYQGTRGVPALITAAQYDRLLMIDGDRGAAPLLRSDLAVVEVPWPDGAIDLDTKADVTAFSAR